MRRRAHASSSPIARRCSTARNRAPDCVSRRPGVPSRATLLTLPMLDDRVNEWLDRHAVPGKLEQRVNVVLDRREETELRRRRELAGLRPRHMSVELDRLAAPTEPGHHRAPPRSLHPHEA